MNINLGGYGDEDYTNSLNIFCSATKEICEKDNKNTNTNTNTNTTCLSFNHPIHAPDTHDSTINSNSNGNDEVVYAFVFAPHPGYSSTYEAQLFLDWGCSDHIRVLPEKFSLSTAEVIVSSNVSMSQCSTVGGQSLSVGKSC